MAEQGASVLQALGAASNAIVTLTTFYSQALGATIDALEQRPQPQQADPVKIANMLADNFARATGELKRKIGEQADRLLTLSIEDTEDLPRMRGRLDAVALALRELAK